MTLAAVGDFKVQAPSGRACCLTGRVNRANGRLKCRPHGNKGGRSGGWSSGNKLSPLVVRGGLVRRCSVWLVAVPSSKG